MLLRKFGPQWLLAFCGAKGEPQMTVQVALDGNAVRFEAGDPIEPDPYLNSAFAAHGVPLNWPDPFNLSAERAVRFAYETFGVRVSEVPRHYMRGESQPDGRATRIWSSCYRWRIVLEGDVHIRGMTSFTTATTRVIWVGTGTCNAFDVIPYIHLPSGTQPAASTMTYVDNLVNLPKTWVVALPFSSPVLFEIGTRAQQVQQNL